MAAGRLVCMLLVFWLCFGCLVCAQSLRDEDEVIHNVALNTEAGISKRNIEHSMRISLVYLDLSQVRTYVNLIKELLGQTIQYFEDTLQVKQTVEKILLDRRCLNDSYFLKNATGDGPGKVRFCKVACDSSKPLCGPGSVPGHHLAACRVCNQNGHDCRVDAGSTPSTGSTNTDFVLFVTASNEKCSKPKTVAYASVCQQEGILDRPVAGFLNVCPGKMSNFSTASNRKELLATFKHEIFHALGFSPSLYAFYRHANGSALTPRQATGMPPYDHTLKMYMWSDKIIKKVERGDWMIRSAKGQNGTVAHSVHMMVTARVHEESIMHFNCSSLEGAELENQGGPGTELAHWEKRLFENEGMTGAFTQDSVFSRITLALMEDTGWYKVNYAKAEPLHWGKNLGCTFVKNSCKAWMARQQALKQKSHTFCNILKASKEGLNTECTSDKSSIAMCNLVKYNQALPLEYQYFDNLPGVTEPERFGGSVDFADFCPYYQGFVWTKNGAEVRGSSCSLADNEKTENKNYALESYGSKSRCFIQGQAWNKTKCQERWMTTNWGSGCYEHSCERDGLKVIVHGYKYKCFHAGQVLSVKLQDSDKWLYEGSIICPPCKDICLSTTCPADVSPAPNNAQPKPEIIPVTCSGIAFLPSTLISTVSITLGILILL